MLKILPLISTKVRCMAFATSTKVLVTGGYDYNLFVGHTASGPAWGPQEL